MCLICKLIKFQFFELPFHTTRPLTDRSRMKDKFNSLITSNMDQSSPRLTSKFYSSVWLTICCAFCYGYNLTSVNTIHQFIKCSLYSKQENLAYAIFCSNATNLENKNYQDAIVEKWSLVASLTYASGIISAIFGGSIADWLGRKSTLIFCLMIDLAGVLLAATCYFSQNYAQFLLGRLLSGLAIGAYTVISPIYINEISPKEINTKNYSICIPIFFNFGVVLAQVLGLEQFFGTFDRWLYCIGFSCLIIASGILAGFYGCESPDWLRLKNRLEQSKINAMNLYQKVYTNHEKVEVDGDSFVQRFTKLIKNKAAFRATIMLTILVSGCLNFTGNPALLMYSTSIFTNAGFNTAVATYCTIGLSFCNLLASLSLTFLMNKFRRKPHLITSLFFLTICNVLIAIFGKLVDSGYNRNLSYGQVISCFIFLISANAGSFSVPLILTAEYVSVKFRAMSNSICFGFGWLSGFVVALLFPIDWVLKSD